MSYSRRDFVSLAAGAAAFGGTRSPFDLLSLSPRSVDELLQEAERVGVLSYGRAGTAIRIDWHVDSVEEAIRAAA